MRETMPTIMHDTPSQRTLSGKGLQRAPSPGQRRLACIGALLLGCFHPIVLVCGAAFAQLAPELTITYAQAQKLFGGRRAKMAILYPGPVTYESGLPGDLYLIDFSKDPLELELICTDAQTRTGDPMLSPDGTRVAYNVDGEVFVRNLVGLPEVGRITRCGFEQRWWVHPVSRDEYIMYSSVERNNSDDIYGRTYMQKLRRGTCQPEGDVKVLFDRYAFGGGRTPSGRYMFTNQPGFHFADLGADSLKVENASLQIIFQGERRCNASTSQDPAHPDWFLYLEGDHSGICYSPEGKCISNPLGYFATQWPEWSTHPDYVSAASTKATDFYSYTRPGDYEAFVYQWSSDTWTKIADHARSTHLWVARCADASPPAFGPSSLSAGGVNDTTVRLWWRAARDPDCEGILSYAVYRSDSLTAFKIVARPADTTYLDRVRENTRYTYYVTALNSGNLESSASNPVSVVSPADTTRPAVVRVVTPDSASVLVTFSEAVGKAGAETPANYAIAPGVSVLQASIQTVLTVLLKTTPLAADSLYTLSVSGVFDCARVPNIIAAEGAEVPFAATQKGYILWEYWFRVSGAAIWDLEQHPAYPNDPSGVDLLAQLATPENFGNEYGSRIRGFLSPPSGGGTYTFWIASDDNSKLFLSTDESPSNKREIACVETYTAPLDWDALSEQRSAATTLQSGRRYYIEVLHKEGLSGDHCSVAWLGPGIAARAVVDGKYLEPYKSISYARRVASPVIDPPEAVFSDEITVRISSAESGVRIYYTTNGSDPSDSSALYGNTPLRITETTMLKARAYRDQLLPSEITTAVFSKEARGRIISPNGGEHFEPGGDMAVRWLSYDTAAFNSAVVALSFDNGLTWSSNLHPASIALADGTNMGEFVWTVPDSLEGEALDGKAALVGVSQYAGPFIDRSDAPLCFGDCPELESGGPRARTHRVRPVTAFRDRVAVSIADAGNHTVTITDLRGAIVARRSGRGAARYILGRDLPSGVYVARLDTRLGRHIAKPVLVR